MITIVPLSQCEPDYTWLNLYPCFRRHPAVGLRCDPLLARSRSVLRPLAFRRMEAGGQCPLGNLLRQADADYQSPKRGQLTRTGTAATLPVTLQQRKCLSTGLASGDEVRCLARGDGCGAFPLGCRGDGGACSFPLPGIGNRKFLL